MKIDLIINNTINSNSDGIVDVKKEDKNYNVIIEGCNVEFSNYSFFNVDDIKRNFSSGVSDKYVRASYLSKDDFCPLAEVLIKLNNVKVDSIVDGKSIIRFSFGTIMHDMLRLIFKDRIYNIGYFCRSCGHYVRGNEYNLYLYCDVCRSDDIIPIEKHFVKDNISGHLDGAIKLKEFGDEFGVFELKSCSSGVFTMLNKPQRSHIIQMNLYMYLTGFSYGVIIYVDRERMVDWNVKQYLVKRNAELINRYVDIVKVMFEDLNNKEVNKTLKYARCGEIKDKNCVVRNLCRNYIR